MPREGHLQQAAQDHTKMASEDLQGGGRLHHLSEQPMPVTRKGQKCVLMFRGSPVAPTQLQQKGRITSLGLLATLPLMQPWRPPASCCKGTLLAPVQPGTHQDLLVLFCKAAFQLVSHQHVRVPGIKWCNPVCNKTYQGY